MRLLVLGGTGVMGAPLVKLLSEDNRNSVYVVSRHQVKYENNVHQITGNAFDVDFLKSVLTERYDAIVDFLWYDENTLPKSLPHLLAATDQYISLSSAAVYVDSSQTIDEDTPRILDVVNKMEADKSREYHFIKARTEDIVKSCTSKNWTIVRPHVTFNKTRIPLCTWEKNVWLFRAVNGLPVAIPKDCLDKKTTFTCGFQVASQIRNLIGKKEALGEIFQLGSEDIYTWGEILQILNDILSEKGFGMKIVNCSSEAIAKEIPFMKSRFHYDRLLNRTFSTQKYRTITGDYSNYPKLKECVQDCLAGLSGGEKLGWQDAVVNAKHDRVIGFWMPLSLLDIFAKYAYLLIRAGFNTSLVVLPLRIIRKIKKYI